MTHRYTVTEKRIEGPVFRAGRNVGQVLFYDFCAFIIDYIAIVGLTDGSNLSVWEKCLGTGLLLLGLFCHLYPLLARKWFVMDDKGISYHAFHKNLYMPWDTIRIVALQSTMRRFNKASFICFSTEESCAPISKSYLELFNDKWFGVQFRPELVEFALRHAKNAILTDDREESLHDRRGKERSW